MLTEILNILATRNQESIKFNPEIKIRREKNIAYITEVKKVRENFFATVEVYKHNGPNDKAILNIAALDKLCMQGLLIRLKGMKKPVATVLLLLIICLFSININAQVYAGLQLGATTPPQPLIGPYVGYSTHHIIIQADAIALYKDNSPAFIGIRAGYRYKFIQPSFGRYLILYSTDKEIRHYNTYSNGYFLKVFIKNIGFEYGWIKRSFGTVSYTQKLF